MAHTHLLDYMPSGHFLGPSAVTQHTKGFCGASSKRHVRTIELNQDSSTQVLKYQRVNRESPSGKAHSSRFVVGVFSGTRRELENM